MIKDFKTPPQPVDFCLASSLDTPAPPSCYWRLVAGSICPHSFVATVENTSDLETVAHESFHYQQLISTPLGLHLALLNWSCCLGISNKLRSLRERDTKSISIPLFNYFLTNSGPP